MSRNGRRVLGAINENIIVGAHGTRNDLIHHKNELNPIAIRSDFDNILSYGFSFQFLCLLMLLISLYVLCLGGNVLHRTYAFNQSKPSLM